MEKLIWDLALVGSTIVGAVGGIFIGRAIARRKIRLLRETDLKRQPDAAGPNPTRPTARTGSPQPDDPRAPKSRAEARRIAEWDKKVRNFKAGRARRGD